MKRLLGKAGNAEHRTTTTSIVRQRQITEQNHGLRGVEIFGLVGFAVVGLERGDSDRA